jgi:hypothetical protein
MGPGLWLIGAMMAAPCPASDVLLVQAKDAVGANEVAQARWCLRGWLTLNADAPVPAGLSGVASELVSPPPFRLYASRLHDQVRVGLHDPVGLVGRLVVVIEEGGRVRRLSPTESTVADRLAFGTGEPLSPGATITVSAFLTRFGGDVLIKRFVIPALTDAPSPPAPEPEVSALASKTTYAMPGWWVIGIGIVATALVGAAVWQETRF